jgi:hypothetical protein
VIFPHLDIAVAMDISSSHDEGNICCMLACKGVLDCLH